MLKPDKKQQDDKRRTLLWVPIWAVCLVCGAVLFYLVGKELGQQSGVKAAWSNLRLDAEFPLRGLLRGSAPPKSDAARPLIQTEENFIQQVGKDTPDGAAALNRVAGYYLLNGDYEAAEATYQELLAILTKHLDAQDANVVLVQENLRALQTLKANPGQGPKAAGTNAPPNSAVPAGVPTPP